MHWDTCVFDHIGNHLLIFTGEKYCNSAVGIQSGRLKNSAFSASTSLAKGNPFLARLHKHSRGYLGSWVASRNDNNQWLAVDLGRTKRIIGINTQGDWNKNYFVRSYYVYYSQDNVKFAGLKHWQGTMQVRVVSLC